ncbi:hypothetical protein [Parafrankia elaeagni]|uniref:hypothetical protein n=1 Tax=Parafrankia elaeagni TaxID=222534 RepID=UPI00035EF71A|nr:hypothetical protein [Parafrankia elaeagni]
MVDGEQQGKITISEFVEVVDDTGFGPANIIEVGDPFTVWVEFELFTYEIHVLEDYLSYSVKYWLNALDVPQPAYQIPTRSGATVFGQHTYAQAVTEQKIPASSLPAGIYQIGAVVTFALNAPPLPQRRYPLTAFTQPRTIQIYEP